jgi:hypothetical protein
MLFQIGAKTKSEKGRATKMSGRTRPHLILENAQHVNAPRTTKG